MRPVKMLILGSLLLASVCCAPHLEQPPPHRYLIFAASIPDSTILAYTNCDVSNSPFTVLDTARIGASEVKWVLVHEMTHAEQMTRYKGGCKAFLGRYGRDLNFKLQTEIQAECAELDARNVSRSEYEHILLNLIYTYYQRPGFPRLSAEELTIRFHYYCRR